MGELSIVFGGTIKGHGAVDSLKAVIDPTQLIGFTDVLATIHRANDRKQRGKWITKPGRLRQISVSNASLLIELCLLDGMGFPDESGKATVEKMFEVRSQNGQDHAWLRVWAPFASQLDGLP